MTFVKDLTGEATLAFGVAGTDLGIPRRDPDRGAIAMMFGDTFSQPYLKGSWLSPTILMYDELLDPIGTPVVDGGHLAIDPHGKAQQLWPYEHNNPAFSTVLPTDFIRIGPWWYVHVMVTRDLGHEVWTEWQRSPDLVHWEFVKKTEPPLREMTMLTFDVVGEHVYIFGTGGLQRNTHIRLWRCPVDLFPHLATWEAWNGKAWDVAPRNAMPIMTNHYGELCFRADASGACTLSYFDATQYQVAVRHTIYGPEQVARGYETVIAEGLEYPQLYGGYLSPTSDLGRTNGAQFIISQWKTSDNSVYKASLHKTTLQQPRTRRGRWLPGLVV